jgi:DNA polymerase-1
VAKIIQTADLHPGEPASDTEKLWVYNALDCMVTLEVYETIEPMLDNHTRATYEFSKSLQAPVLEMNMHGVLIDKSQRDRLLTAYSADINRLATQLNRIIEEGIGIQMNWNSPQQLKELLYERLRLPPVRKRNAKGQLVPTADRGALEKLSDYFVAQPIINHILALRDLSKKAGVLRTSIDTDGRIRTSFNIGGTTTGRLASSLSDFGTGTNLQNIEQRLRRILVADPGYKFAYIDLEQAESRAVAGIVWNLFQDGRYLDACESGDLHTSVCKMAWRNLPWTGNLKEDKDVAELPFYRMFSYRDMAKRLGHGSNYYGQPAHMAKQTKIEQRIVSEFQGAYFSAFPGIPRWHAWVQRELRETGYLVSLTGRKRWFFGRRDDPETLRAAIAFSPQGGIGDILNSGMLAVWRSGIAQLLLQIHDAILIQYREADEDWVVPQAMKLLVQPFQLDHGRTLVIPCEAKVGWNWANQETDRAGNVIGNPNGLAKWRGHDDRQRVGFLDEVL